MPYFHQCDSEWRSTLGVLKDDVDATTFLMIEDALRMEPLLLSSSGGLFPQKKMLLDLM
jgi:hypothetical protein